MATVNREGLGKNMMSALAMARKERKLREAEEQRRKDEAENEAKATPATT